MRSYPRAGTVERAVHDAMHAVWCGDACPNGPGCTEWAPSTAQTKAAVKAVRDFDDARFREALAKEQA